MEKHLQISVGKRVLKYKQTNKREREKTNALLIP